MAAPYLRKSIVSADHLNPGTRPPWIVLWDTTERSDGHWSVVRAQSEANATECAAHFLKLGFVVHAIKDPSGTVVMDARSIAARFAPNKSSMPAYPERRRSEPEYVALTILRNFAEDRQPIPGLMIALALVQTRLSPLALNTTELDRAVSFAAGRGWLTIGDGILTLTREGCAAALG
ncbi:MAG TPA: hypothetical protein VGL83_01380 [Stellaceae bacterium]|jgi:hypothetical protein